MPKVLRSKQRKMSAASSSSPSDATANAQTSETTAAAPIAIDTEKEFAPWLTEFNMRSKRIHWASGGSSNTAAPSASSRALQQLMMPIFARQQAAKSSAELSYLLHVNENNLHHWMVKLVNFDRYRDEATAHQQQQWPLLADMRARGIAEILLEVIFPASYPDDPPFVRVVTPVFAFMTGHVTVNGAVCMEMLTGTGWQPKLSFDSLMAAIVENMLEGRLDPVHYKTQYSFHSVFDDYRRFAQKHGWLVPASLNAIQSIAREE